MADPTLNAHHQKNPDSLTSRRGLSLDFYLPHNGEHRQLPGGVMLSAHAAWSQPYPPCSPLPSPLDTEHNPSMLGGVLRLPFPRPFRGSQSTPPVLGWRATLVTTTLELFPFPSRSRHTKPKSFIASPFPTSRADSVGRATTATTTTTTTTTTTIAFTYTTPTHPFDV